MSFGQMKKKKKVCNKCRRSEKSHSFAVATQVQTLERAIEEFGGEGVEPSSILIQLLYRPLLGT